MGVRHYPLHQIFDINGNPIGGGTVSAYQAGTTTAKSIYTNETDAINQTNGSVQVTLPADASIIIWFTDDTKLKLVLADSTGATLTNGVIDNISGEADFTATTTKVTNVQASGWIYENQSTPLTAAATTDLSTATGNLVPIVGTTTITALGTVQAGACFRLRFGSALTLTYNATSLIIPGAANLAVQANDTVEVCSLGSGNWEVTNYLANSGLSLLNGSNTIASAATITVLPGIVQNITGTTTITAIASAAAGTTAILVFAGVLTLTYNATSLILPTKASIITAANDSAVFVSLGSGNWQCVSYQRATGQQVSEVKSTIASATTTDLSTVAGDYVSITGTTSITGLGTMPTGIVKVLTFTGILTLTYNATSLITPTAANITTAVGDCCTVISEGSGNWRIVDYLRASGYSVVYAPQVSIASATTTDLSTTTSAFVSITGTTTITGLGTVPAGIVKYVTFSGALTLTQGAAISLPNNGANITTAANDRAIFISTGSGNWICLNYTPAVGTTSSFVLQRVSTETGAVATGTTTTANTDTIPTNTSGDQYMSLSITPKSATSVLVIEHIGVYSNSVGPNDLTLALFQDSTTNALASAIDIVTASTYQNVKMLRHIMTSGTTSSTTFKIRVGAASASTTTFNGKSGSRTMGGSMASTLMITEYSS